MSDDTRKALEEVNLFGLDFENSPPTVPLQDTPEVRPSESISRSQSPSPDEEVQPISPIMRVDKEKQESQPSEHSPASERHLSPPPATAKTAATTSPSVDKGKQKEQFPSISPRFEQRMPSATQTQYATPPVPLGQRLQSTQIATQPALDSPGADDEDGESSDGEIPIKPIRARPRVSVTQRRPIFDPLNFDMSDTAIQKRTSSQPAQDTELLAAKRHDEGDKEDAESTDSDMLSAYERSRRPKRKDKKRKLELDQKVHDNVEVRETTREESIVIDIEVPITGMAHDVPIVIDDESIPASESLESYSLSKQYPSPPKPDISLLEAEHSVGISRSSVAITQYSESKAEVGAVAPIMVDNVPAAVRAAQVTRQEADSLGSSKTGSGNTQSLPTPPPSDDLEEEHRPITRQSPTSGPTRQVRSTAPSRSVAQRSASVKKEVRSSPMKPALATPSRSALVNSRLRPLADQTSFALDLTVDGLTEERVQEYITRIKAAREKQQSRAA